MKTLFLFLLIALSVPASALAIILDLKDGIRVSGYLIEESDSAYTVKRVLDGHESIQTFPRSDVLLALRTFDPDRLAELSPDQPAAYRNYAEELSEKRQDPEARDLALRLFLIAASLDPEKYGRGGFLSMASLARSPAEERRYRAVAYLLDPRHDRSVLKPPDDPPLRGDHARHDFARALGFYRTRQTARALSYAKRRGVPDLFDSAVGIPSYAEFVKSCENHPECSQCGADGRVRCPTCKGTGSLALSRFNRQPCPDCLGAGTVPCPDCQGLKSDLKLDPDITRAIIRCELSALSSSAPQSPQPESFSRALLRDSSPVPSLSIDSVSPFNPRQTLYRNGRWVEPNQNSSPSS